MNRITMAELCWGEEVQPSDIWPGFGGLDSANGGGPCVSVFSCDWRRLAARLEMFYT